MDFYRIETLEKKNGTLQLRPDWRVGRVSDLMTRSGTFYAIWDEERGLWSTDIYDVQRLVDADLRKHQAELEQKTGLKYQVATMESSSSKLWDEFQRYIRNSGNNSHNLDENLVFSDTDVRKADYASKRLPYALREGDYSAWDTLVGTLYNTEERAKIEWAIGAVVSGDSKRIQKFLVFYGPPGSGKSTILNVIQKLFEGYHSVFDARELAGNNNAFATSAFKSNPLVAIQHDGDLSRIFDNTKLNSIVAHETMTVNEKYKAPFESKSNAFLFMGTNVPVKITDAKSGIIRRLIDVVPTQQTLENDVYHQLMDNIDFQLGAIAYHCLMQYQAMGKNYYSGYRPTEMMLQTDVFYNFVESYFDVFKSEGGVSLKRAYALYKEYCAETGIDKVLPQYKLREELKNYFYSFEERAFVDGVSVRSYYRGFKHLTPQPPVSAMPIKPSGEYEIELGEGPSIFDELYAAQPAQYALANGNPKEKWADISTTLNNIRTSRLHYVKIPEQHIVIDFDLTNESGEKDLTLNLEAAAKWPATYTELSKSGMGVHLHYDYTGDVTELASVYSEGIEVKTLLGGQALRRKLTKCNKVNITPISSGLPKKEKSLISDKSIKSEKGLRELIERNLRKEIHPGTKSSVDFIHKILEEAYENGMSYDLRDMRGRVLTFALQSTNQADKCIATVQDMKFVSAEAMPAADISDDKPLVFFDIEVYPNLFVLCWKRQGSDEVVKMVNPSSEEVEPLLSMKLVGFNNRRYDNHVLYARYLGWSTNEIHKLSQKIINGNNFSDALFGEAYNLSWADIYDFSSKKQGLKKFEIELGIHHQELDLPWDEPVDESLWSEVIDYCVNDVRATEAVFEARHQDYVARQILAKLSGLTVNHTTKAHTAKIIFGDDKDASKSFVYTDLSEMFPGYNFDGKESVYHGEVTGEGGYVYAEPGVYENVAVLDITSMHPTSIKLLNLFGPYTERFNQLTEARVAIKRKDYKTASGMLDGKLAEFLDGNEDDADGLAYALKIVINIVYGLTSAKFPNPFKDNRNKDNIVAKRGALFMIDLKRELESMGFSAIHIKTDSIKIPNVDEHPEVIDLITEFGKKYGYNFEHEVTYDKFCLVNDAVYIALDDDMWTAVGAQFQQPYVFKTLFSGEELEFRDYCETKNVVQGSMYLDFGGTGESKDMVHVGRTGSFMPVTEGGADLWRIKDGQKYAVTGTKGFKWIVSEVAKERDPSGQSVVDLSYFDGLVEKAKAKIDSFDTDNVFWKE